MARKPRAGLRGSGATGPSRIGGAVAAPGRDDDPFGGEVGDLDLGAELVEAEALDEVGDERTGDVDEDSGRRRRRR